MRKAKPVRFRIPADRPGGLYAAVTVWPSRRAFEANDRRHGRGSGRTCRATCTPLTVMNFTRGAQRTLPIFAELNFCRGKLTMEIVTHELFHASMAWARRVGFDFTRLGADDAVNQDEERLTYVHGRMSRRFVHRAIRLGLYREQSTVEVRR